MFYCTFVLTSGMMDLKWELWVGVHASYDLSSVQPLICVWLFVTPWLQHTRLPCPSSTRRASSNSCPSSRWCHPTISSPVVSFSCLQSVPASGSFPMSQFFTSGGQSIGVSASTSVLPMNIQDWFPLRLTGWISLQSKGLSRVFSNTTVQKHQFFSITIQMGDYLVAQMVRNLPEMQERDPGSIPESRRFPGEGNGYPFPVF